MNPMEYSKLEEELNNINVRIVSERKDQYTFIDTVTKQSVTYQFHKESRYYVIEKVKGEELSGNHLFYDSFVPFVEKFLKEQECYTFVIDLKATRLRSELETRDIVGFVTEWQRDKYWTNGKRLFQEHYFIKEKENIAKTFFFLKEHLMEICNALQKEDPTLEYDITASPYIVRGITLEVDYKGITEMFRIQLDETDTEEDLEKIVRNHLQQIEKRTRLQRLYEPPKKYLKRMLGGNFLEKEVNIIFEKLTMFYEKDEIEKRAALYFRRHLNMHASTKRVYMKNGKLQTALYYNIFDYKMLLIRETLDTISIDIGTKKEMEDLYVTKVRPFLANRIED